MMMKERRERIRNPTETNFGKLSQLWEGYGQTRDGRTIYSLEMMMKEQKERIRNPTENKFW